MIKEFNREVLRQIETQIAAAAQAIAAEHGIKITAAGGAIGAHESLVKLRLEVVQTADGRTPAKADWDTYSSMYGLKPDDFGKQFHNGGATFTITGIKPRTKRPILATRAGNGQEYVFAADVVRKVLVKAHAD